MNGTNLVLDTNILIYYLTGDLTAYEIVANNQIFISVITEMEMLSFTHLTEEDQKRIEQLLSLFTVISLTDKIKNKTIQIRKTYKVKLPDAIIAATALQLEYFLVTADKKLQKIDDLQVVEFQAP